MKHTLFIIGLMMSLPVMAEDDQRPVGTDADEPAGFVTELLNKKLDAAMMPASDDEPMEYGRKVTKWASAPKFGGYAVGGYKYSGQVGKHGGDGFYARNLRLYVDGTVLRDFKYRMQVEMTGDGSSAAKTPHIKDFFVAWSHWKELEVKVGQFKRGFTFENPYNPWEVGVADYSQLVKKLAGMGDHCGGEATNDGGRDLGLQLQGDVLPVGKDKRRLFHYQVGVFNGQGINHGDANHQKDVMGTLQLQPVKDLYVGVFGWKGNMTYNGVTVHRNRYAFGAKYEHEGWTARAEYAHHVGQKIGDYVDGKLVNPSNGRADAWYVTVGVPCTKWLKFYAKYDAYRDGGSDGEIKSIYTIAPNFQIHKNLMLQVQWNHNCDHSLAANQHWEEL
ncbi:MAG: hypothetical protein HUK02_09585, partial [Bacteroidaceae bacterium]|nr:hypothetical protein [Bacteroidaceae bacterium]